MMSRVPTIQLENLISSSRVTLVSQNKTELVFLVPLELNSHPRSLAERFIRLFPPISISPQTQEHRLRN